MRWTSARPWASTVARLVLGVVWIWAALSEMSDPRRFVQAVRAYEATPEWLSRTIGYGLPVLELALGVLLVAGLITRSAALVSTFLLFVFAIGLIQAAARGLSIECGCFGGGGTSLTTSYPLDIVRDLALLALAVLLVLWPMSRFSVDERLARADYVEPPSAKRMRSPEGQRKYRAAVEARAAVARSRSRYLNAAIVALIALVGVVGIGVQSGRAKIEADTTVNNASVAGGVRVGKQVTKVTIDLYEDFQCPACLAFHEAVGKEIDTMIGAGYAQVHFHLAAFLDDASRGNRYSSRAANAAMCAVDVDTQAFLKYYDRLFQPNIQPRENSTGRTNAELIQYARDIGVTNGQNQELSTFITCVQSEQHKTFVQAVTEDMSRHGLTTTPTVRVNGKTVTATKAAFDAAVLAVGAGPIPTTAPPTPTGTPSTTGSPSASSAPRASTPRPSGTSSTAKG